MELLKAHIIMVAKEESPFDDDNYEIGCSGNHGDTFDDGMEAGRIELARTLLELYFKGIMK